MKSNETQPHTINNYIQLDIESLSISEISTFDIYVKKDLNYKILIEAGTLLSEDLFDKLKNQHRLYIDEEDQKKQILTCRNLKSYIRQSRDNPQRRVKLLYKINEELFENYSTDKSNKIHVNCVELIINSIIYLIK